jgi:hypothetical protein
LFCRNSKCGKTVGPTLLGFGVRDFTISTTQTPTHNNSQIAKSERIVGPTLRGFGVQDFAISNSQTPTHNNSRIAKSERTMGPALRGFGVQNFGVYEHLTHKQKEIGNVELRNEIRVWAKQFQVSAFGKAKELRLYITSKSQVVER